MAEMQMNTRKGAQYWSHKATKRQYLSESSEHLVVSTVSTPASDALELRLVKTDCC